MDAKQSLRRDLIAARKAHHQTHGDAAARALAAHVDALALPQQAIVAAYLPVGSEMDTRPLMAALHERNHILCLPVCFEDDAPLGFRRYTPGDALAADAQGIEAPLSAAQLMRPDIVLLPLLGFDGDGMRLGRGGGYYDRSLAALRADGPLMACGLTYQMQMVDKCPHEPHDQALDAVLTETGLIRFERKR